VVAGLQEVRRLVVEEEEEEEEVVMRMSFLPYGRGGGEGRVGRKRRPGGMEWLVKEAFVM
jgi:hypothetical protein